MEDPTPTIAEGPRASRFELAPPRRFVLPAILLLLSERPSHGYSLEKDLWDFNLGKIDRPTIYRALADLEKDGLVTSRSEAPKAGQAGQARRVYQVTPLGERELGLWMRVVKDERDSLARVLRRYHATGTPDAVLAEVEGGWAAELGAGWSPVSPTSLAHRRLRSVTADARGSPRDGAGVDDARGRTRFALVPDRSVILIEVRSTVGPIGFGGIGITGTVDAEVARGMVRAGTAPGAHLEVAVDELRSGNGVYDAELMRRIDARRFPTATIDLRDCVTVGAGNRFRLRGELTFHGVTRPVSGTVTVDAESPRRLVVTGEQVFDIRDFDVPSPTVLMLRIYPDVRVHLHIEAETDRPMADADPPSTATDRAARG